MFSKARLDVRLQKTVLCPFQLSFVYCLTVLYGYLIACLNGLKPVKRETILD